MLPHAQDGEQPVHVPTLALRSVDAAKALGISPRLLWDLTARGVIPSIKLNSATIYPVSVLEEWLKAKAKGAE